MRAFACPTCRRLVTFESTRCLHCGTALAFDPATREIVARDAHGHPCANDELAACNWLAPQDGALCEAWGVDRSEHGVPRVDFALCAPQPGRVATSTRTQFNQFLASRGLDRPNAPLPAAEREQLFREFLKWNENRGQR